MYLQHLLDEAANDLFAAHNANKVQSLAILIHRDGTRENIPLQSGSDILDMATTFEQAETLQQELGAIGRIVFHHAQEQGKELVFIAVEHADEKATTAFGVAQHTGHYGTDLVLLTGTDSLTFGTPSNWKGKVSRLEYMPHTDRTRLQ